MAIRPEAVTLVLKRELKNRKMKYDDLAERLGLSVSGLKKVLASKDLSLSRLQAICDVLGLPLVQVLSLADEAKVQDVYLTEEQETLLLKNPDILHLYWKLRFDQIPLHQYLQGTKISREEMRGRLRKLEKVGLVRIGPKGDLEFSDRGMIRWNNSGPLVEHLNRKWSAELVDSILKKKDPRIVLNLAVLNLSEASFADLNTELRDLVDRYSTRSQKDRYLRDEKLKKVALLTAADEYQFIK